MLSFDTQLSFAQKISDHPPPLSVSRCLFFVFFIPTTVTKKPANGSVRVWLGPADSDVLIWQGTAVWPVMLQQRRYLGPKDQYDDSGGER